ncbi:MAG: S41 family peptidase [Candidatus Staskawiczbacteria bacterium]|nr:S41 family peptidase [Candidatus Staskawiczbacteria bacterium]
MNYKKIIYPIILIVAFAAFFGLGAWVGVTKMAYHVPQPGTIDFSLFWDAYSNLQNNFINPSKITDKKVLYGAIEGMASSLGDPYTSFFDPEQAKMFQQDLNGSFEGIGVEIGIKKDLITVIAPLKDTPGEAAGLKSGDIIVKIDGKDATNMTTEEAVNLIRGPKGTSVTLNIFRSNWNSAKDIKITRGIINVPSIEWSLKQGDVAYIQIYQFGGSLPTDFEKVALEILQSPAKKIILDLRNNPGGYLDAAQNIAGWFIEKDKIVTIEDFGEGKDQQIYKTQGNANLSGYPMVVLINEGSASASEILAGALRDNRNIKLVGVKSFGKGCVQEVLDLPGGSFLKITIANWLTPKGGSISDVGLTPDIKVEITEKDAETKKDPQLDKALEIVGGLK